MRPLTSPLNGEVGVNINNGITWSTASIIVTGYLVSIGTTPGGTDIANNVDVGLATTYNPGPFAYETTYYVSIVPYNDNGNAENCNEESFTTRNDPNQVLDCNINETVNTVYCYENNDATGFNFQSNTGAPLFIFFNAGQMEGCCDDITIYDGVDNTAPILFQGNNGGDLTGVSATSTGDALFVQIDSDFSINCQGNGYINMDFDVSCVDTTSIPNCNATLTAPANGAIDVNENDDLNWTPATIFVEGYTLYMGTTPGGTDVLNGVDVGNVTTYEPGTLDFATTYYVTIIPYNLNGDATNCTEESFYNPK